MFDILKNIVLLSTGVLSCAIYKYINLCEDIIMKIVLEISFFFPKEM
jgi:hypothetical protein